MMRRLPMRMIPDVGAANPASRLRTVDLPHPLVTPPVGQGAGDRRWDEREHKERPR